MKPFALAAGAAVTILLASCGTSSPTTGEPASSPAAPSAAAPSAGGNESKAASGIEIVNFKFSGTMTVKPGEQVTVTNKDTAAHTATGKAKEFDTGNIAGGASGKFTAPKKAGSYPFVCTYHPNMTGTLIVKA